ncbi:MAG: glycosyltransferase WbuB [Alphaproteobacteria bacterium]|nr:MAG: glycosyltransferase WbuB [Alphaproteobacteria bacterium]
MRILYHHRILAADGMQVHVRELTEALARRGHEIRFVAPEGGAGRAQAGKSLVSRLAALRSHLPRALRELMEIAYDRRAAGRLQAAARAWRPDIVYERYNAFLSAGLRLRRTSGLPWLVEVNAPLVDERKAHGGLALDRIARRMEHAVWRGADAVLPVSDALAEYVRRAGVAEERIHVIPNGVRLAAFDDLDGSAIRDRYDLGDKLVFGFVGFVRPWHGLERVLDAFARLGRPDLHLLIVGDGPARPAIEARALALGLDRALTVTGVVDHAGIPSHLGAFDVALQPDVTPYASPLKLFEYMAAGLAVIAPDRANIREIVRHGETAFLMDPGAAGALEAAIVTLAEEADLRRRLGAAARAEVEKKDYTWDGNARRVEAIAEALIRSRAGERKPAEGGDP